MKLTKDEIETLIATLEGIENMDGLEEEEKAILDKLRNSSENWEDSLEDNPPPPRPDASSWTTYGANGERYDY